LAAQASRSGHCEATMGARSNGDSNVDWNRGIVVNRIRLGSAFFGAVLELGCG
jgi:hypothetical protein